jgi:hypothetical protein
LICAGFVAGGVFALYSGAPGVGWMTIIIFGGMLILASLVPLVRAIRGQPLFAPIPFGDGRDYRVEAGEMEVVLKNKATGEEKKLLWADLTAVYIVAIDRFPMGDISYVLHRGNEVTEIPTDAEGNEALLAKMQERLPGFDNRAFIESMSMLHGFKQVWSKQA